MTKEEKKLLELLEFSVNEKAKMASSMMNAERPDTPKKNYYHGRFAAFSEVYTMIQNIKRTL
jgi:hypothetical protein